MDKYLSVCSGCATEKIIEKSRFITHSEHVENEEQAKAFIAEISRRYSDATHNCYAYIADEGTSLMRFSDDGEPQGTAGMPILEVLKNRKLAYTAVVVTRYFGGIKLGAGGLVRAYSGCTAENLNAAKVCSFGLCSEMRYFVDYSSAQTAARYFKNSDCNIISCDYSNGVIYTIAVKAEGEAAFTAKLNDILNGKLKSEKVKTYFAPTM